MNIIISQRTGAHVIKSYALNPPDPPTFVTSFGTFGVAGSDNSHLNFPWMIACDDYNNVYVCDHENQRIVKLDSDLSYVNQYSTSSTIGRPCTIIYDSSVGDLYVVGVHYHTIENDVMYMYVNIERLTTGLVSISFASDIMGIYQRLEQNHGEMSYKPTGIVRGYEPEELLIFGIRSKIYSTIENGEAHSFSTATEKSYIGHAPVRFMGTVRHSNDDLYLNTGKQIVRFNAGFVNMGSSNATRIYQETITSPQIIVNNLFYGLKEGSSGSLIVYDVGKSTSALHPGSIMRYDDNLNFVETICAGTGSTVETNFDDVMDFVEVDLTPTPPPPY